MIGVAVNWLLLMVPVLNNQNVGLRYANPTYSSYQPGDIDIAPETLYDRSVPLADQGCVDAEKYG